MKSLKKKLIRIKDNYINSRVYNKYARVVINNLIRSGDQDNEFLDSIRDQYIKATISALYRDTKDPELVECIEYVKNNSPRMFCYNDSEKCHYDIKDVHFDENSGLYYGFWNGKRLFFKRSLTNPEDVRNYLSNSFWEQSEESPHRYLTEDFDVSCGGVVFDVGGAEGNFAISVIDKASRVFIFECDNEWVEALNKTFEDYKDKVVIIRKYVSNKDSDNTITIDSAIKEYNIDRVDMIKMDIEGAEIRAIKGAKRSIVSHKISKWAVCTYHDPKDAPKISKLLRGYDQEFSRGYIMSAVWRLRNLKYPYWVKGVLRAKRPL